MSVRVPGPPSCHCATCADEGVPMRVLGVAGAGLYDCAGEDGETTTVDMTLVEPVAPDERVLVHAGVALVKLDGAGGAPPPPNRNAGPAFSGHMAAFGTRRPAPAPRGEP